MEIKFWFLIPIALSLHIHVNAQINFTENVITSDLLGPDKPNQIITGDIDNDGDKDVVFSSSVDDLVGWYENIDSNGKFASMQIISDNADVVKSVNISDLDGDGDMDVLSASWFGNNIVWYENIDGLGSFGPAQIIDNNANYASFVYSVDIDGDNDIDVLSASDYGLKWYENIDGLGNFVYKQTLTNEVESVFATDLDEDGDIDVLSASTSKIAWYENINGEGVFGNQNIISTSVFGAVSVYAEDIDGDNDMDVLSASSSNNGIGWYENTDGQGTFSTQYLISANPDNVKSIYSKDIDGDGDIDVLTASKDDDTISWYENTDGLGTFDEYLIDTTVDLASSVYADDIDNDGDIDVISSSEFPYQIFWHKNSDGMGSFDEKRYVTTNTNGVTTIFSDDIDGDGDLDILTCSKFDNKIAWYENIDGTGNFNVQHNISTSAFWAYSVFSSDIDNDGDIDVLYLGYNEVAWFKNTDGQGSFGNKIIIDTKGGKDIKCADIDGDGYMDVIAALYDEIVWYKNIDGLGDFSESQLINADVGSPSAISTGDIDGDGDIDVLSASSDTKLDWSENIDGQGNFSTHTIHEGGGIYRLEDVVAVDFDNDSDLDVLFGTSAYGKIGWYENLDGNGNFSTYVYYTTTIFGTHSLFVADMDGDQDVDIISSYGPDLAWFKNLNGQGAFGDINYIADNGSNIDDPRSVVVAELNGTGLNDIVASTYNNDKIAWYNNLGDVNHVIENNFLDFKIYPNPSIGKFRIQVDTKIIQYRIFNIYGQPVLFKMNNNQINISGLTSGLFYVELIDEKGSIGVEKVIKL